MSGSGSPSKYDTKSPYENRAYQRDIGLQQHSGMMLNGSSYSSNQRFSSGKSKASSPQKISDYNGPNMGSQHKAPYMQGTASPQRGGAIPPGMGGSHMMYQNFNFQQYYPQTQNSIPASVGFQAPFTGNQSNPSTPLNFAYGYMGNIPSSSRPQAPPIQEYRNLNNEVTSPPVNPKQKSHLSSGHNDAQYSQKGEENLKRVFMFNRTHSNYQEYASTGFNLGDEPIYPNRRQLNRGGTFDLAYLTHNSPSEEPGLLPPGRTSQQQRALLFQGKKSNTVHLEDFGGGSKSPEIVNKNPVGRPFNLMPVKTAERSNSGVSLKMDTRPLCPPAIKSMTSVHNVKESDERHEEDSASKSGVELSHQ